MMKVKIEKKNELTEASKVFKDRTKDNQAKIKKLIKKCTASYNKFEDDLISLENTLYDLGNDVWNSMSGNSDEDRKKLKEIMKNVSDAESEIRDSVRYSLRDSSWRGFRRFQQTYEDVESAIKKSKVNNCDKWV